MCDLNLLDNDEQSSDLPLINFDLRCSHGRLRCLPKRDEDEYNVCTPVAICTTEYIVTS